MKSGDTIAALATAPAIGAVGVIRISGPEALERALAICPDVPRPPKRRYAHLTQICDARGVALDEGLFLYFERPHSFTGEEVVELQTHGSPRVLELVLEALRQAGVRAAEPGEFSRRAFMLGRIDLAQAEAVADLIAAQSVAAVRAAAAQVRGSLSARLRGVRQPLLALHADLEGALNFPDEAEGADAAAGPRVAAALIEVSALVEEAGRGRLIRRGARVVLFGPVNAGKSTLFNRLLGEDRALVDEEPGTTRDVLEAAIELQGVRVVLMDTAGLRDGPGRLEALGIARAKEAISQADYGVLVVPPGAAAEHLAAWREAAGALPFVEVLGKADLGALGRGAPPESQGSTLGLTDEAPRGKGPISTERGAAESTAAPSAYQGAGRRVLSVSGKTGAGISELRAEIGRALGLEGGAAAAVAASERHADALQRARDALGRAAAGLATSTLEVVAGEVGLALEALGDVTGENTSEELLDAIFRRFCIGK